MKTFDSVCYFIALVLFVLAAFMPAPTTGPSWRRVNLGWLGLAVVALVWFNAAVGMIK